MSECDVEAVNVRTRLFRRRDPGGPKGGDRMPMATVRLQMSNGQEVYFRAPRSEISRLVLSRHRRPPEPGAQHVITTEKNVPISFELREIRSIHIM